MNFRWCEPFLVKSLHDRWESAPGTPGVYVISCGRPLRRVGAVDSAGILYVGKSLCLKDRLWSYWEVQHEASAILWEIPQIASMIFAAGVRRRRDVERLIGSSMVRVATPIRQEFLDEAERAVLYAYTLRFGEPPPLNSTLPGRWTATPKKTALRWAEQGLRKTPI